MDGSDVGSNAASEVDEDYEPETTTRRRGRPRLVDVDAKKRRARQTAAARGHQGDGDIGSLYETVKYGRNSLTAVVDEWIESYKQERDVALLNLIQFFIHSSGCRGKITPQMYSTMEHAEIIRKMTEEFDEESGDYPLILSGPQWKKFKNSFCEFIQVLVRQCQYSIIYDQYMMDNIISLLTGLTDSQVRAFRHTSTLASMKLMTALVDVALNLSVTLDNTQRQYDIERQKTQAKRADARLDNLMQRRQEIEENQEEIKNMLTYIFKGVFVHRYRDTQAEIRAICMQEIGNWMKSYPSLFLDDSYLKYVGWTMYDRSGDVRLCCLKCLQPLYDTDELIQRLELFTNRFKDRIVEMTLDKEYDVAVAAVKLVIAILGMNEQVLSDKDCESIYELVYSSHRAVAQAAGEFLNAKLFRRPPEELGRQTKSRRGKKRSENTPLVRDLVQFFIESELHEHGAYLVDSMWDINPMMKDWECMTDLLLEEAGKDEEALDDRQEISLIEIMVCCVKQAATGEYPVGRGPTRRMTSKESKQVHDDKVRLTEHFIQTLPQLLAKYSMDAEKVSNLLNITNYFELDIYTSGRLERYLELLLRCVADIVEKHTDSEVLENCAKLMELFCSEEYQISNKVNIAKSTLIDNLVDKYKDAYADFFNETEEATEDDAYALMAALKRIYAFNSCHDLNTWDVWDSLYSIVKGGLETNNIPDEIVCKALGCCHVSLLWYLSALSENNPDKSSMKLLKQNFKEFMTTCQNMLFHQQDRLQEDAYITLCDLLVVFSKNVGQFPALESLVYTPDKNLQNSLSSFLCDKVFIEDDDDETDENQKIEELHKRRNFLAGFCKLIAYNVVSIPVAANMFKHYMKFYNDYGDIIKATLGKAREINKKITAKTLATSLTSLFTEVQKEQDGTVDRASEAFVSIKELARRFSLSFGLDQTKNREAVAAMHKEGILFAMKDKPDSANKPPPNVGFLEVLAEFTGKLIRQDKKTVVNYLDKQLQGGLPSQRSDDWAPLLYYRNSLVQAEEDAAVHQRGYVNKPGRRKRKIVDEAEASRVHTSVASMKRSRAVTEDESEVGSEAGSDYQETPNKRASAPRSGKKGKKRKPTSPRASVAKRRQRGVVTSRSVLMEDVTSGDEDNTITEFASPPGARRRSKTRRPVTPKVARKVTPIPRVMGSRRSRRLEDALFYSSPSVASVSDSVIDQMSGLSDSVSQRGGQ